MAMADRAGAKASGMALPQEPGVAHPTDAPPSALAGNGDSQVERVLRLATGRKAKNRVFTGPRGDRIYLWKPHECWVSWVVGKDCSP